MGYRPLKRRTFLRGMGGVAVALPALDIMLNSNGTAYADGSSIPCRYVLTSGGFSLGVDNDSSPGAFVPDNTGPDYDLKAATQSLASHGNIKDRISIVSGLEIPAAGPGNPPAPMGVSGDNHFHWHQNPMLCGNTHVGGSFDPTVTGPTSDQVMAQEIGDDTVFRSLVYRVQASMYVVDAGPGTENHFYLSHREDGSGNVVPVPPVISPRQAWDTLFTGFTPTDPDEAVAKAFRLAKRRSVLDLVERRMTGGLEQLGSADQQRLEQHLEHIRELERVLESMPPETANPECMVLGDPGNDPTIGGEVDYYLDYDINKGYSDEHTRALTMVDIMHMALVCDLTRVGSLMFTMWQSYMNAHPLFGISRNCHDIQHRGANTELYQLIDWHMDHFGRFVSKLRDTPEGDGSLLDSCAIGFLIEGGRGAGFDDNAPNFSSHAFANMAWLVAGGAGGLRQGEHIIAPPGANHPGNVLVSLMNAAGVERNTHGEVTGPLPDLF